MVARDIGEYYRVVIWHEKPDAVANVVTVTGTTKNCRFIPRRDVGVTVKHPETELLALYPDALSKEISIPIVIQASSRYQGREEGYALQSCT